MKTIHKFPFLEDGRVAFEMPEGAEILTVQVQGLSMICLWALIDTEVSLVMRKFGIFGTGQPISVEEKEELSYIGTVQTHRSRFVWHVFEIKEASNA